MGRPEITQALKRWIEGIGYEVLESKGSTRTAWKVALERMEGDEPCSETTFRKYIRKWEEGYTRLEPDAYIEPWSKDWLHDPAELGDPVKIDDPTKAEVLLTLHYHLEALAIPEPRRLTKRQAKFALLLHNFFDLSKRRDALALLVIAHDYARVHRWAEASGNPPDSSYMRALDERLLVYSGRNPRPPAFYYWLPVAPSLAPTEEEEIEILERVVISFRSRVVDPLFSAIRAVPQDEDDACTKNERV
jgi:hypothetical protein